MAPNPFFIPLTACADFFRPTTENISGYKIRTKHMAPTLKTCGAIEFVRDFAEESLPAQSETPDLQCLCRHESQRVSGTLYLP